MNLDTRQWSIKVAKEYDLIKNEYTGKLYVETDKSNGYEYTPVSQSKFPVATELIPVKPMLPPNVYMTLIGFEIKKE